MRSRASSQLTASKQPEPFAPVRTRGSRTRSGQYRCSAIRLTLLQMKPAVRSVAFEPRTRWTRPSTTSTFRLQASGQSRGQDEGWVLTSPAYAVAGEGAGNEGVEGEAGGLIGVPSPV